MTSPRKLLMVNVIFTPMIRLYPPVARTVMYCKSSYKRIFPTWHLGSRKKKLLLNTGKCKFMVFGTHHQMSLPEDIKIIHENTEIERAEK